MSIDVLDSHYGLKLSPLYGECTYLSTFSQALPFGFPAGWGRLTELLAFLGGVPEMGTGNLVESGPLFPLGKWPDQACGAKTNEVGASRPGEGFYHKVMMLGVLVLEQGPLESFFVGSSGYVDFLPRTGIDSRVVHAGGESTGSGVEVLYLFGNEVMVPKVLRKFDGCGKVASRMTGDEVRYEVLFLLEFLIDAAVGLLESKVHLKGWFTHRFQDTGVYVFGRHFQLAGYVELAEFPKKRRIRIGQQVIVPDPRTNEHLFYPRKGAKFSKELEVIPVIDLQVRTGGRD
jgi:hypothetical protein